MSATRTVEYGFLFLVLAGVGYIVWKLFAPFLGVLSFAVVLTALIYPVFVRIQGMVPWKSKGVTSAITVAMVYTLVIGLFSIFSVVILREARTIYRLLSDDGGVAFGVYLQRAEDLVRNFVPGFSINIAEIMQNVAGIIVSNITSLFAGTATTVGYLFLSMLISFYLLRDGKEIIAYIIKLSPLQDIDDKKAMQRMVGAIRGVIFGVVVIALVQSIMTMLGLTLFGVDRAVLFGFIAAFAALIPGVGAGVLVFAPLTIYFVVTGHYATALGVGIWGAAAVGTIDNILGPYIMRIGGTSLHPLMILLSVLGGIAAFGLIGFVVGPVIVSLFIALLEIYTTHIAPKNERIL